MLIVIKTELSSTNLCCDLSACFSLWMLDRAKCYLDLKSWTDKPTLDLFLIRSEVVVPGPIPCAERLLARDAAHCLKYLVPSISLREDWAGEEKRANSTFIKLQQPQGWMCCSETGLVSVHCVMKKSCRRCESWISPPTHSLLSSCTVWMLKCKKSAALFPAIMTRPVIVTRPIKKNNVSYDWKKGGLWRSPSRNSQ